jgi:hypothetical protein
MNAMPNARMLFSMDIWHKSLGTPVPDSLPVERLACEKSHPASADLEAVRFVQRRHPVNELYSTSVQSSPA